MADFNIAGFQNEKTILPTFKFMGEFIDYNDIFGYVSNIKPWHILSVSYEQHTFKQEGQYHGPGILKTFPVLDRGEAGAYKLIVTMEEDNKGTIMAFIEYLKSKIINKDGVYNSIDKMKDLQFQLEVMTNPKYTIFFDELYFQSADSNEFSYGGESKTYTINLAYDNYRVY